MKGCLKLLRSAVQASVLVWPFSITTVHLPQIELWPGFYMTVFKKWSQKPTETQRERVQVDETWQIESEKGRVLGE